MKRMSALAAALLCVGCSYRTATGQFWHNLDECVVIDEKDLDASSIGILKEHIGPMIALDGHGTFFVHQSLLQRAAFVVPVVILTPATLAVDGLHVVVRGCVVPEQRKEEIDRRFDHPTYLAVKNMECGPPLPATGQKGASGGIVSPLLILQLISAIGRIR